MLHTGKVRFAGAEVNAMQVRIAKKFAGSGGL
jgi:hypothetical protein